MSTVAYKGGVFCADRQAQNSGAKFDICKMDTKNGVSIAWVGVWTHGRKFADWYFAGADLENLPTFHNLRSDESPDFSAIVMTPKGCQEWTEDFVPEPVGDFAAIGSGKMAAMAAMHLGVAAAEAVLTAHKCDCHTGKEQDVAYR